MFLHDSVSYHSLSTSPRFRHETNGQNSKDSTYGGFQAQVMPRLTNRTTRSQEHNKYLEKHPELRQVGNFLSDHRQPTSFRGCFMGNNLGAFVGDFGWWCFSKIFGFCSPPENWGKMHPYLTRLFDFFRWVGEKPTNQKITGGGFLSICIFSIWHLFVGCHILIFLDQIMILEKNEIFGHHFPKVLGHFLVGSSIGFNPWKWKRINRPITRVLKKQNGTCVSLWFVIIPRPPHNSWKKNITPPMTWIVKITLLGGIPNNIQQCIQKLCWQILRDFPENDRDVSENRGTPKSSMLIRFPYFWKHP